MWVSTIFFCENSFRLLFCIISFITIFLRGTRICDLANNSKLCLNCFSFIFPGRSYQHCPLSTIKSLDLVVLSFFLHSIFHSFLFMIAVFTSSSFSLSSDLKSSFLEFLSKISRLDSHLKIL